VRQRWPCHAFCPWFGPAHVPLKDGAELWKKEWFRIFATFFAKSKGMEWTTSWLVAFASGRSWIGEIEPAGKQCRVDDDPASA